MHLERSQRGCKHTTLAICACTNIRNNNKRKAIRILEKQLERVCKVYGMRFGNVHHHMNALLRANFYAEAKAKAKKSNNLHSSNTKCDLNNVPSALSFGIDIPLNYW